MDQEGCVPANKSRKIDEDEITKDYIVQNMDDNAVDKPGYSPVISDVSGLTDDAWLLLVVDYLDIDDWTRIERVCRRWRELVRISWKNITRLSLKNIFERTLQRQPLKNHILEVVLPKCGTSLQSLSLSVDVPSNHRYDCQHFHIHSMITPNALELIGLYCTSLEELKLSKVFLTETALKTLAERLPNLRSLNFNTCCIQEEEVGLRRALQMLQSLTSLNVGGNYGITGDFFCQAPQTLTEVYAEDCYELTDEGVRLLAERCANLETIDISHCCKLTGLSITALATNCPKLKRFKFNRKLYNDNVLTSHLLTLSKLPLLEGLHVDWHNNVTDEVFKELGRHCPLLRSISCVGCRKITDAAILHLSPCLHLESIDLSSTFITDEGLNRLSLAHSERLNKVYLRGCLSITDKGVGCLLSAHRSLLELDLEDCQSVTDGVLPILESRLQHRQHTQPLKIGLGGTSVDQDKLLTETIGCNLVKFSK